MAYFYIRDHADGTGTATGDGGRYATQQIDDWDTTFPATTQYYGSFVDAFLATTPPVSGDIICFSDIHLHTYVVSVSIAGATTGGAGIILISVDDSSMAAYKKGASEIVSLSNNDLLLGGAWTMYGVSFQANDDVSLYSSVYAYDCVYTVPGASDRIFIAGNDSSGEYVNCTFNLDHNIAGLTAHGDSSAAVFYGGAVATISAGLDLLIATPPRYMLMEGVDLTGVTGHLVSIGGNINARQHTVRFHKCELNAGLIGFNSSTVINRKCDILVTNSSSDSAAAEYQYYQQNYAGEAEDQDDAGIHRDESTAYPSGTKASIKAVTSSVCGLAEWFGMDFPARFAALSSASTDTIRIYFAVINTVTLTNTNCWAELIYPDGTNKQHYNCLPNRAADLFGAGVEHTTDSGSTWLDGVTPLAGYNEYYMDLDTSVDPGADSVPVIRIYLTEPSVTVYFDTTVDVVA